MTDRCHLTGLDAARDALTVALHMRKQTPVVLYPLTVADRIAHAHNLISVAATETRCGEHAAAAHTRQRVVDQLHSVLLRVPAGVAVHLHRALDLIDQGLEVAP